MRCWPIHDATRWCEPRLPPQAGGTPARGGAGLLSDRRRRPTA
ncbi:hypothetical protein [Lysobacter gummosus]